VFTAPGSELEESICDKFAAAILMPRELFEQDCSTQRLSGLMLRRLAQKYRASLAAVARRYSELNANIDFALVSLTSDNLGARVARVLFNFRSSKLRPDCDAIYGSQNVAGKALLKGTIESGWDWFRERFVKRKLYFYVEPDRKCESAICLLTRQELGLN
jgi:hypothetical protein